jgi:hypothetical protein
VPVWKLRKILHPPGFDPRTIQPVASLCTDWAIPSLSIRYLPGTNGTRCLKNLHAKASKFSNTEQDPEHYVQQVSEAAWTIGPTLRPNTTNLQWVVMLLCRYSTVHLTRYNDWFSRLDDQGSVVQFQASAKHWRRHSFVPIVHSESRSHPFSYSKDATDIFLKIKRLNSEVSRPPFFSTEFKNK